MKTEAVYIDEEMNITSVETAYMYTGQEYEENTDLYNYRARQYAQRRGHFLAPDPQHQFHSPYVAMGNNPVNLVDPDGEWAMFAVVAFMGAQEAFLNKENIFWGAARGVAISALSAGIGSIANVHGILPGAFFGAGSGFVVGGTSSVLYGENFLEGGLRGARIGAVTGAIQGGIAAHRSEYERNLFRGSLTDRGQTELINHLAEIHGTHELVDNVVIGRTEELGDSFKNTRGRVIPVVDGQEVDIRNVMQDGSVRSNFYMNLSNLGRSKRIESTFLHEMQHVIDLSDGAQTKIYNQLFRYHGHDTAADMTRAILELRGKRVQIDLGFRIRRDRHWEIYNDWMRRLMNN